MNLIGFKLRQRGQDTAEAIERFAWVSHGADDEIEILVSLLYRGFIGYMARDLPQDMTKIARPDILMGKIDLNTANSIDKAGEKTVHSLRAIAGVRLFQRLPDRVIKPSRASAYIPENRCMNIGI